MPPAGDGPIPAYLGLDIGSVSTNVVAIDEFGAVIHDIYLRTAGRPIEAVQQGLSELARVWGTRLEICGVGTTGSGRELIAEFVGADVVNDEITAHKTGAVHISQHAGRRAGGHHLRDRRPGFQIHLHRERRGGGLRHERSLRGRHRIVSRRAGRKAGHRHQGRIRQPGAGAPRSPTRLGERCTVFMERDVTGWLHKGETVPNLLAGLAYSIALNYLNRVVRGRKIGNVIYFQGGTAYNDAVTAAFAGLLGKKITVPPYNGVMGAIGMALIARQWHLADPRRDALSRIRPRQAAPHHARFRLQGLLEFVRHEGIRDRGPEELLG